MPTEKLTEKSVYEKRWQFAIKTDKVQLGNLQINIEFLEQTGLIQPNIKALELGGGSGSLASFLHGQGISVIGSDISQTAIEYAQKLHPDVEFRAHSADELPYQDSTFDIVMSFDVLEHLSNVDRHLCEVSRVLKPGGYYLLQTPNKFSNVIFETLKSRSTDWKRYHPSLHFFGQLKRRLMKNGFNPQFVKMNTMNEYAVNKFKGVGLPGFLFRWINFRYLPFRLQTNFYVIAKKASG